MIEQLQERYSSLSIREKVLIVIVGLVLIALPMYTFWIEVVQKDNQAIERQLAQLQQQYQTNEQAMSALQLRLREDPNQKLSEQLMALQSDIKLIDEQLAEKQSGLIPVSKMAAVLEQLLKQSPGVSLLSMQSLAPTPLLNELEAKPGEPNFYRHGIRIELESDYFSLLRYLRKVEDLQQGFLWMLIDYQVEQHPQAKVMIEIYTLSTARNFIGA